MSSARRYEVNMEITSIILTVFNLDNNEKAVQEPKSALQYLFSGFLDITGYGRQTISSRSRSFRLSELSSDTL